MNNPVASSVASAELKDLQETTPLEAWLEILSQGDFQSRWDAAKAIPHYGEAAITPLLELLQDEATDGDLIWFIARILGHFHHPVAINSLVELLLSTDNPEIAAMAAAGLANAGEASVAPLSQLLSRPSTRLVAVQALAQMQHPDVIQPLLSVIHDPVAEVRAAAVEALSYFYGDDITAVLLTALKDPAMIVRRAAVIALGIQANSLNSQPLIAALSPLLWDLNLEVCRQTAIALARIGTETAVQVLAQVLRSAHTPTELKIEVVRALVRIDTLSSLEQLKYWLTETEEFALPLGQEVITALGRVESAATRPVAVSMLLHLLATFHPIAQTVQGKQQIASSLGQLQDARAIEALIHLLTASEVSVRLHAISALKQLQTQGSYERLQALATNVSTDVCLKANLEAALQEWNIHSGLN